MLLRRAYRPRAASATIPLPRPALPSQTGPWISPATTSATSAAAPGPRQRPRSRRGSGCSATTSVGCGRGETLSCLRAWGFAPVHGCDIGAEQVAAARAAGLDVAREDAVAYLGGVK